ncbi:hypothetical protein B0A48_13317 [Cryoendolithus antarcticus]|uniref:Major facilitator superfamily (MFS) profile domain-containing protein n=1 Tax=Cryoendolithus antarcticus TaxID=1507870 RepID=A0A1V8SPV1_9PEZI|nr:hypothetical protein B0A48_13317 [Cryoendolithus antarcticus]
MAPGAVAGGFDHAALVRRQALAGQAGPMAILKNGKAFMIACFACLGGLLYGYNQGVFGGVLVMHSFKAHMGAAATDPTRIGFLTSILELGAWFGTIYSGFLAEIYSRKYAILFSTGTFILGVVIQTTSVTSAASNSILAGRFITGMGVGSLSMIVPMYNAECAPPEVRGAMVGLQQLAITTGIMISFWIDYGTNYIGGSGAGQSDAAWLVPLTLQIVPAVLLGVGMLFMPFSPRWLVHHDREDEARKTLASLRNLSSDHELIELEFLEIKAQSMFEKRSTAEHFPHLADGSKLSIIKLQFVAAASLFKSKPMFRRVMLATLTMFFQQWTGINAVLYYAPQIFTKLGQSSTTTSLLATGVVGIVMWLATIPAVMYVDKLGRKPILVIGAIGMALCHFIIAVIFAKNADQWPTHQAAGWAAIAMVWLFVVHFGYSWGPCAWIVIAEIWPISQRPYGIAIGASSNWMNNFIVGQVTPDMLTHLAYGTYIFFGVLTSMGAAFIYFFFPETKGLSLEEMDTLFGSAGVAAADAERMREINSEIGLEEMIHGSVAGQGGVHDEKILEEKAAAAEHRDRDSE